LIFISRRALFFFSIACGVIHAQVTVSTAQNDNSRTAANLAETTLNTSNVNVSQFGKVYSRSVDGVIYAQPLYVPSVTIPAAGTHNVVYVATMHNTVFAFDADDPNATAPLWQTSLGTPVVPLNQFTTEQGILSTPVIDTTTSTLYAVALASVAGTTTYQLHALDNRTGAEKPGSPVSIQAVVGGSGYDSVNGSITFNTINQLQRTALLLSNGVLYFAFASYADMDPYHGWIFAYNASTLQQVAVLNIAPGQRGGIWQSGGGLAADSNGSIYAVTGNGPWDGVTNFGDSILRLTAGAGLAIADYFTTYNYDSLNAIDFDLGSSRPILIPRTNLIAAGGKDGIIYIADRTSLGHQSPGNSQIVQTLGGGGGIFSGLAYWDNASNPTLYAWPNGDHLKAYSFNGTFQTTPTSSSQTTSSYPIGLSVSSNGTTTGTGVVWASTVNAGAVAGTLHAFDATNLANELWNSDQNSARDSLGNLAKFAPPTIANGKVYVATFSNQLVAYGLLPTAPVVVSPASAALRAGQNLQFTSNLPVSWSINPALGTISSSGLYIAPASVTTQQTVIVTAVSQADATKTATATITLTPITVTVTPATASLFASGTQQFSASVVGTSNSQVTWSINPTNSGSISASGLYTAPASVGTQQNVTVTATSAADNVTSSSSTVTLNPSALPTITQQPRNASVFVAQTATLTVSASGGSLTYQWQSMPAGGGAFTAIAGATASFYTTPVLALADDGTQYRCVITNPQGSVTSNAATLTVLSAGTPFLVSQAPGTLRNNFSGWVGMSVLVGNAPLVVTSLGRFIAPGNTGTHILKIFDPAAGADVPGGSVTINTAGAPVGTYLYRNLPARITLNANAKYYIVSQETLGGDQWYDNDTTGQPTIDGLLGNSVYTSNNVFSEALLTGGRLYVPLNFIYTVISVSPPAASLYAGQSQQFTADVSGLANSVVWSISPTVGSVSSTGLYTAPALIPSTQNVSVIATSTADNTRSAQATITLLPVNVSVGPPNVTVFDGQIQQFTAAVTNTTTTGVTWSINPTVGTISSSGLYTAPSPIASTQVISVIATSTADPTKSGSVAMTISAPVKPIITTQPQATAIMVGQSATFSVNAVGGSLTYQWQSMGSGANSFTNIGGATSSSYTVSATTTAITGTQYRCIVSNTSGSATSSAATLKVVGLGGTFIASAVVGTPRNDLSGWVGMSINTGPAPVVVTALGRIVLAGNTGTHAVKIVDASTGNDIPGAIATVNTAGVTAGTFAYAALFNPITLSANASYLFLSQEAQGGDQWFDLDTTVQTSAIAVLNGPAYGTAAPYNLIASAGHSFGPVDFSAPITITVAPTTANLSDGQTQQFTASVAARNSSVTWSLNPNVGSISAAGVYTAPATVSSNQTITVTATSVADVTKSASASVMLSLPAPPSITQQPQSATIFTTQSATFSVSATGPNLIYQWQSMAPGGTAFITIAGATSSSYTTNPASASDNGTQFQCIVSNRIASLTTSPATLTVLATGVNFIASTSLGSTRNDFTGWVGMSITVGPSPLVVSSLGRIIAPGNSGSHSLKIVDASTGGDLSAPAIVNTSGATSGTFVYGPLPAPLTLNANSTYYILSLEAKGGDGWYDYASTSAQTATDAQLVNAVFGTGAPYNIPIFSSGHTYGPVDLQYVALHVAPSSAAMIAGETQQFTAVGVGISPAVIWTVSPLLGSISSTGLYTAPASVSSSQTVTVQATSTADANVLATASITIDPQAAILQQPKAATVFSGQQATFTISTSGLGMTYQWQVMAPGAPAFTNIAGATSNSYTTGTTSLSDTGTQFRCIATSSQGVLTSNAAVLTVVPPGTTLITATTPGTLRNNATGWYGLSLNIGPNSLIVTALGRLVAPGNTGTHTLKIVDASGVDVSGANVTVNTSGATAGNFLFGTLASPVTLQANSTYYLLSQETQGGDQWYDSDTLVQTTTDASVLAAASGGPPYSTVPGSATHSFVPVNLQYVSLQISPTAVSLYQAQTQQFTVSSAGISSSVTWSISPAAGVISSSGFYTAPAIISSAQTVTVTATSTVNSAVAASGTITLQPVVVTLNATTATLFGGQTQQFTATVTGTGNPAVSWAISPSGAGSISSSGLYSAPASISAQQVVTVTATSASDPTKSATSSVTLVPVSVTLAPASKTLFGGQTQQFTATVSGAVDTSVIWTISPSTGSISTTGLYSAPSLISSLQNITVTATANADTTKIATGTIALSPDPPAISSQPVSVTSYAGSTATFAVTATGLALTYQWQTKAPGATSFTNIAGAQSTTFTTQPASLSDNGTQFQCVVTNPEGTAASTPATLSVLSPGSSFITSTALGHVRNDFTGWVGMSIHIGSAPLSVRSIGRLVLPGNTAAHLMKIVSASDGTDVPGSSITINTAGVTPGIYVYGAFTNVVTLAANATYYVLTQETSGGDQFYDNDTVAQTTTDASLLASVFGSGSSYTAVGGTPARLYGPVDFKYAAVNVSPTTVTLFAGQTQQFTGTVSGVGDNSVTWTINPAVGSISASGLYTTPALISNTQTITITATSVADSTKQGTAAVTLVPVTVAVSPTTATLFGSQTQQFAAAVTGTGNPAVTWSLNPAAGTVSSTGLFTAPSSVSSQQTVNVIATSVADPGKTSSAVVTLLPPSPPIITQQPVNVLTSAGQTATFSVSVLGVGLSYQWQSMPSGANSFSNIAGATSNSYTSPSLALTDNATQFRCVVTNAQGSVSSNSASLTVGAPASNFVLSATLGALQNDFTGWVGTSVTIAGTPLSVNALGRIVATGNTGMHTVKIVDASTGNDVPGGSATVNTAGGTIGTFVYANLVNPVTLNANSTYYVLSQEVKNGENWYDGNTILQTTNAGTVNGVAYGTGAPYNFLPSAGHAYVPVDFSYKIQISVSISPVNPALYPSQTQQFSATVSGNTGVTWSIAPNIDQFRPQDFTPRPLPSRPCRLSRLPPLVLPTQASLPARPSL